MPEQTVIYLVIMAVMVGGGFAFRAWATRAANQRYSNYRLVDLAQRAGLAVLEGDPAHNMMMAHANFSQQRYQDKNGLMGKLAGDGTKQLQLRLGGQVWNRPYEFVYFVRKDIDPGMLEVRHTTWFDCSLAAAVAAPFPDFEVTLRNPAQHLVPARKLSAPAASLGNPALDQVLVLNCADPRVGPMIAPALVPLMTQGFVHILAQGGRVRAMTTEVGCYALIMNIEVFQRALEQIACALEGRAATHVGAPAAAAQAPVMA